MNKTFFPAISAITFISISCSGAQTLVPFAPASYHGGGLAASANSLAAADFNGDGHPDLLSAGGTPGSLALVMGTGSGGLLPEKSLNAESAYNFNVIQVLDVDADGDQDIVVGETDSGNSSRQIVIYENNGSAEFTRKVVIEGMTGNEVYGVAAGDLNGDGNVDFVRRIGTTTLVYIESLAGGGFAAAETVANGFTGLGSLKLADLDGDSDLDLLATDSTTNLVSIFFNDGVGNFGAPQTLSVAATSTIVEVADITVDARPDILTTEYTPVQLAAYYAQQPDGSFGARTVLPLVGTINCLKVADLDEDGVPDIVIGNTIVSGSSATWNLGWSRGTGGGGLAPFVQMQSFGGALNAIQALDLDGDSHPDIAAGGRMTSSLPKNVFVFINKTGENPMVVIPPVSRSYVMGDRLEVQVHFGFPITVTGTPNVPLQIGANIVNASYVSGSGTSKLLFRYTVAADLDLDGVQLANESIDLNGGTIKDPLNGDATLILPADPFDGVIVNGAGPLVQSVSRLDVTPTTASTVRFTVQFAEAVQGVDAIDFEPVTNAGDLTAAAVQSVTGSGNTYEVSVSTGTGSGTLGLSVKSTASISDSNGNTLGSGFVGGQVYTLKRSAPSGIEAIYRDKHADYRPIWNDGELTFALHADAGAVGPGLVVLPSEKVLTYAGPTAIVTRSTAATYDFLGVPAGSSLYLLPSAQKAGVPFMGFSGESVPNGIFASYSPSTFGDTRVTSTSAYIKVQMVAMRSSTDGHMSVYTIASGNPRVWMATTDGISSTDVFYQTPGSHSHRNVAFSKPGTYEVDIVVSGFRDENGNGTYDAGRDTYIESGIFTMVFGVDFPGEWRKAKFGSSANSGAAADNADPDSDGVNNLLEYAFGLHPGVSTTTPLELSSGDTLISRGLPTQTIETDEGSLLHHAIFLRRKDHVSAGLNYAVQFSNDLTLWQTASTQPEVIGSDSEMDVMRVLCPEPAEGESKQFMRLKITGTP